MSSVPFEEAESPAERMTRDLDSVGVERFTARGFRPGILRHIVLFRYRDAVGQADRLEVDRRFHALAASPRDGEPYVASIESGAQTTGEPGGERFHAGFVVTFTSEGDRNFYVGAPIVTDVRFLDAEHARFKDFVGPLLADVQVFDFVVG